MITVTNNASNIKPSRSRSSFFFSLMFNPNGNYALDRGHRHDMK